MSVIQTVLDGKSLDDLVVSQPESVPAEPALTEAKVSEAISLLKEVEKNNGILAISKVCGLTVAQIKQIQAEMSKRISELRAEEG